MPELPFREVQVLDVDYKVQQVPHLASDTGDWAAITQRDRVIKVDPDADFPTVLIHEAFHALEHAFNLEPLEEPVIHQMAKGWSMVLRDNPDFVIWILKNLWRNDPHQLDVVGKELMA